MSALYDLHDALPIYPLVQTREVVRLHSVIRVFIINLDGVVLQLLYQIDVPSLVVPVHNCYSKVLSICGFGHYFFYKSVRFDMPNSSYSASPRYIHMDLPYDSMTDTLLLKVLRYLGFLSALSDSNGRKNSWYRIGNDMDVCVH